MIHRLRSLMAVAMLAVAPACIAALAAPPASAQSLPASAQVQAELREYCAGMSDTATCLDTMTRADRTCYIQGRTSTDADRWLCRHENVAAEMEAQLAAFTRALDRVDAAVGAASQAIYGVGDALDRQILGDQSSTPTS